MKRNQILITVFSTLCFSLLVNAPLNAQTSKNEEHQHNHGHNELAGSALKLNQGNKWQTDAALRQGMQNIYDSVMNAANAFHHASLTQSEAKKLAAQINGQVEYLVANCQLEPQADAVLHVLIGELLTGAEELSKEPLSNQGLPQIVKVLQRYPDYFDHPGWKAVTHE